MNMIRARQVRLGVTTVLLAVCASGCAKWRAEREARQTAERERAAAVAATRPSVPNEIAVNARTVAVVHAHGNQIYTWDTSANGWKFKEPAASFSDNIGEVRGTHFAGPTWKLEDGSSVKARRMSEVAAPTTTDAPWLLLEVTSHEGNGLLSRVEYIQRINTDGGRAPDFTGKPGQEVRVPYRCDYVFREAPMTQVEAMPSTRPAVTPATMPATQPSTR